MAVILPGPLVSDVRGKVGDLVFGRNSGGLYVRSKGTVTQTPSDPRAAAIAAMTYLSNRYRVSVTSSAKAAWTAYANLYPDTDRWGRSRTRTGQQTYIEANFHSAIAFGYQYINLPPPGPPRPKADIAPHIHIATDLIHIPLPLDNWPTPSDVQVWYVYQSAPVYSTRNYCTGPFRFAGYFYPDGAGWPTEIEIPTIFDVTAGKTSWIRLYFNDNSPRAYARPTTAKATAA